MRKATKTIISFAVVLIAGLNLIVPALAQDPFTAIAVGGLSGASGAGLFGSMATASGIDIGWSGTADEMDAMWNVLNPDQVYFSGEKHEATNIGEDVYDYIEVDIGDWLSAQSDFIVNFAQTYNVTDDSQGTTESVRTFNGAPLNIWAHNAWCSGILDSVTTTNYNTTYTMSHGNVSVALIYGNGSYDTVINIYYNGNRIYHYGPAYIPLSKYNLNYYVQGSGDVKVTVSLNGEWNNFTGSTGYVPTQQSKSWESGKVDTSVFDGWESAKVKIPSDISQLQTGWTLPDFLNELDRIWSGAGEDNILIEDGSYVPPVPPTPVPSTPLGEVPFDDWVDLWGQGIYDQLENQSDALDFIGSNGEDAVEELESIDTGLQDLNDTAESIDTNIGVGNGILGGIRSLAQSAVNYLEGIAEHVGELVEEIVEGTETLIAGILNQIPQVFSVIFGPIKQASSIWHYVVEWIQSIGAPFQFIWSMASGTSYYIVLPVYASLAAAVVLAFYKRFGK